MNPNNKSGVCVCEDEGRDVWTRRWQHFTGEKKNYSLLQNMGEWTTESLKPEKQAGGSLGLTGGILFRDRICFMSQSRDDHDLNIFLRQIFYCLSTKLRERGNDVSHERWQLSTSTLANQIRNFRKEKKKKKNNYQVRTRDGDFFFFLKSYPHFKITKWFSL